MAIQASFRALEKRVSSRQRSSLWLLFLISTGTFFTVSWVRILTIPLPEENAHPLLTSILPAKVRGGTRPLNKTASDLGSNLTVIAIGCNRVDGLLNALDSAKNASYVPYGTKLHICIDGCGNDAVEAMAEDFVWPHGEKIITARSHPFGLAKHIAECWVDPKPGEWAMFMEDDVMLDRHAFSAFEEALHVRNHHPKADHIIGVALHDVRVNQYCWQKWVSPSTPACPELHQECDAYTPSWSVLGSLVCDVHEGSWNLRQFPSSWGALYEGSAWARFKYYASIRSELSVGESLLFSIPTSMSNEWLQSWKSFMLELMVRSGWTVMYRHGPNQQGYSRTMRYAGVHTEVNEKKEKGKRCLISMPLLESDVFPQDALLRQNSSRIRSFDYCSGETSIDRLSAQGEVSTNLIAAQLSRSPTKTFRSRELLRLVQSNIQKSREKHGAPDVVSPEIMSSGYNISFPSKAEMVMVTTFPSTDQEYRRTAKHFAELGGSVLFLVTAPASVCAKLMRDEIHAICIDEHTVVEVGNPRPVIVKLLRAAYTIAGPTVKWIGFMNGDITFEKDLTEKMDTMKLTGVCDDRCAVIGQRTDVDWQTKEEKLHSPWGMDYFIFNIRGLDYVLESIHMPNFTVGLVRWDSWLTGHLVLDESINVVDATELLRVQHFMALQKAFASKKHTDRWNLKLANEEFHLGRTDNANFKISGETKKLVTHKPKEELRKEWSSSEKRYKANLMMERATDFVYTSGPLSSKYFPCVCQALSKFAPGNFTDLFCSLTKKKWVPPDLGGRINIHNEVLSSIVGSDTWTIDNELVAANSTQSECCIKASPSEEPATVPGKFWTIGHLDEPTFCFPG